LKDKLTLPDAAIEKTAYIYRKVHQIGLVQGRSIPAIIAAAVYLVCREMGIPSTASNIRRKTISRTYRLLILELEIKVPLVDPMKCIVKVANKANLSESTSRKAISIMNEIRKNETLSAGKEPMGLAATVLYLSSLKAGENITQDNISNAAGITGVTLRNRFKALKSQLQLN
jgi:transcription initiation factor TFIIB